MYQISSAYNQAFNADSVMLSPFVQKYAQKLPSLLLRLTRRYILGEYVRNTWIICFLSIVLIGCGSSGGDSPESTSDITISTLIGTTWESATCELAYGYPNTTSEVTITETALEFEYFFYEDECVNAFSSYRESRSYTTGDKVIVSSGVTATEIDITTVFVPLDYEYIDKNLIYNSGSNMYFGIDMSWRVCLDENRVDIPNNTVRASYCDQRAEDLNYDRAYTRKI